MKLLLDRCSFLLPIGERSVAQLPKLPDLHRDPFDRMLVCQAIARGLTRVTPDQAARRYPALAFRQGASQHCAASAR